MRLIDVVRSECVCAGAKVDGKGAALKEVVRVAKQSPILGDVPEEAILKGIEDRESLGSTGFGRGIAIPHCRLAEASDFVVGVLTIPDGVDFDSLDEKKARIIVFIIAPELQSNEHIRLLSAISQTLMTPGAVEEMVAAGTSEALLESFLRHTRGDIEAKDHKNKNLLNVLVQDESLFRDILQVLAGAESSSVVVLEAENTRLYLAKTPLFAGFWSDDSSGFARLIMAIVDRKLANETIRRIEELTGNLDERSGVMVMMQEIMYASGQLEA